jgi:hypothetical protein
VKALQAKAGAGNVNIVRLLIDTGADVSAKGVGGGSAFAAARNRSYVAGINTATGYSVPKDVSNISPQSSAITAPVDISAIYSASLPLAQM